MSGPMHTPDGERTYPREWFRVSNYGGDIQARTFVGETPHKLRYERMGKVRLEAKSSNYDTWYPTREEAEARQAEIGEAYLLRKRANRIAKCGPELVEALREYEALMEQGFADSRNVERVRGIAQALLARIEGTAA